LKGAAVVVEVEEGVEIDLEQGKILMLGREQSAYRNIWGSGMGR
jgi:hypothetical protein